MRRQEFVDRLRTALAENVSNALVTDYVSYYENYIDTEINKGRSEEEVLNTLGDPRLIARTIIQTNNTEEEGTQYSDRQEEIEQHQNAVMRMPGWVWVLVIILILVIVLGAVMSVLSFLAPILIPALLIWFLIKLFRDWLN